MTISALVGQGSGTRELGKDFASQKGASFAFGRHPATALVLGVALGSRRRMLLGFDPEELVAAAQKQR
jgi:hypothetical protein